MSEIAPGENPYPILLLATLLIAASRVYPVSRVSAVAGGQHHG
jgi:hypothetical protein